tara:strand:+ start:475 stop:618 length:144 start_codon:yes stop_codon:yes gene_type:complete
VFDLAPAKKVDKERLMLSLNARQLQHHWHRMDNVFGVYVLSLALAYG